MSKEFLFQSDKKTPTKKRKILGKKFQASTDEPHTYDRALVKHTRVYRVKKKIKNKKTELHDKRNAADCVRESKGGRGGECILALATI